MYFSKFPSDTDTTTHTHAWRARETPSDRSGSILGCRGSDRGRKRRHDATARAQTAGPINHLILSSKSDEELIQTYRSRKTSLKYKYESPHIVFEYFSKFPSDTHTTTHTHAWRARDTPSDRSGSNLGCRGSDRGRSRRHDATARAQAAGPCYHLLLFPISNEELFQTHGSRKTLLKYQFESSHIVSEYFSKFPSDTDTTTHTYAWRARDNPPDIGIIADGIVFVRNVFFGLGQSRH
jgi:hypothetical protein